MGNLIDSVVDFFKGERKFTQGDVLEQIRLQNPQFQNIPDDQLTASIAAKKPEDYSFFKKFDPVAPVEPAAVPFKVRNAKFYEMFPDIGKTDAETLIKGVRANYPQLKDVPEDRIAAKLEAKNPMLYKGLTGRLAYGTEPEGAISKLADKAAELTQAARPDKLGKTVASPVLNAMQKTHAVVVASDPASIENKLLTNALNIPENAVTGVGKDVAIAGIVELGGVYKGLTGQELDISPETLQAIKDRKIDPRWAQGAGEIVGATMLMSGIGKVLGMQGMAGQIGQFFSRTPEVARYLAPILAGGAEFGGVGLIHEGIKQAKEGNLDMTNLGKVVLKNTAIGAGGGMFGGFNSGLARIAGSAAFGAATSLDQGPMAAAVNGAIWGAFAATTASDITQAQKLGAYNAARENIRTAVETEGKTRGYTPEEVGTIVKRVQDSFDSSITKFGGNEKMKVSDFENVARGISKEVTTGFDQIKNRVPTPAELPAASVAGVTPSPAAGAPPEPTIPGTGQNAFTGTDILKDFTVPNTTAIDTVEQIRQKFGPQAVSDETVQKIKDETIDKYVTKDLGIWQKRFVYDAKRKSDGKPLIETPIIHLDIDNLKKLNTDLGHFRADILMKKAMELAREYGFYPARLGGDEFVFVMNPKSEKLNPFEMMDRFGKFNDQVKTLAVETEKGKKYSGLTFSAGFGVGEEAADAASILAKNRGKGRVTLDKKFLEEYNASEGTNYEWKNPQNFLERRVGEPLPQPFDETGPNDQSLAGQQTNRRDKPLAGSELPASPGVTKPKTSFKKSRRQGGIVSFIKSRGGINTTKMGGDDFHSLDRFDLTNNKTGMALDYMREAAAEEGFLPHDSTGSDLIALVEQEIKSKKLVKPIDQRGDLSPEMEKASDATITNVGDLELKKGDTFQFVGRGGAIHDAKVSEVLPSGDIKITDDPDRTLDVFDELRIVDAEKLPHQMEVQQPKTEPTAQGGEQSLIPGTPDRAMPGKALEPNKGQVEHRNLLEGFKPEIPQPGLFDQPKKPYIPSGSGFAPPLASPNTKPPTPPPGITDVEVPGYTTPETTEPQAKKNLVYPGAPNDFNPKIEMPELVKFAEMFLKDRPLVKRSMKALGLFYHSGRINIVAHAFTDPVEAAKILAHEIGHMIDWLPDENMNRGNILGRLKVLIEFRKTVIDSLPTADDTVSALDRKKIRNQATTEALKNAGHTLGEYIAKPEIRKKVADAIKKIYAERIADQVKSRGLITREAVTKELKEATSYWHPFDPNANENFTKYRFSSRELYAEALSMMLVQPEKLKEIAPIFYKAFWDHIDRKPEVKQALLDLDDLLGSEEGKKLMMRERDIRDMFVKGEEIFRKKREERYAQKRSLAFRLKTELIDKNTAIIEKVKEARKTGRLNPEDDPVYYLEAHNYLGGKIHNLIQRIETETLRPALAAGISEADFGEYLFLRRVATERQNIANPLGHNQKTAEDQLKFFMAKFNDQRKAVLEDTVAKLDKIGQELNKEAFNAGLYKNETIEQISKNTNYATFQVLDYLDEFVTSRVVHQVGTFKDIANPYTSTILKMISLKRAIERNQLRTSVVEFMKRFDAQGIKESDYRWTGKSREIKDGEQKGFGTIPVYENGTLRGYYVDPYIADSVNFKPKDHNNAVVSILRALNSSWFRPVYVNMNLGFQSFNAIRDFMRFWKLNPETTLTGVVKAYARALPSAYSRVWGKDPDKIIQEMNEHGMLGLTYNDVFHSGTQEDSQIEHIMRKYNVGVDKEYTKRWYRPAQILLNAIEEAGNFVETLPKVARYITAKDTKLPIEQVAHEVRVYAGSPDFMRRGSGYNWTNNALLFSNAIKEGVRGDFEGAFKNPRTRAGYWWKTAALNILPKLAMFLAAGGFLGKKIAENYARQSEYDKANYLTLPLGDTENGLAAYGRIPQDEAGRFVGALFWKLLNLDRGLGKSFSDIFSLTAGQVPSLSPSLEMLYVAGQYLAGQNPYDFFRGRNVLTDDEQKARGIEGTAKIGKWFADKAGLPVQWAYQGHSDDPTAVKAIKLIPVLNRFIKHSDYGLTEQFNSIRDEVQISLKRYSEGKRDYSKEELNDLYAQSGQIKLIDKYNAALRQMEKDRAAGLPTNVGSMRKIRTEMQDAISDLIKLQKKETAK